MKKQTPDEKFQKGFERLQKKYMMTKARVVEFATQNPDMMYYSEDGMKLVILGMLKLAIKLQEKTKTCIKKKSVKKK